jgi:uncharacterized membrane protein
MEALTLLGAALFTGGALYVSLVEHPARLTLDSAAAVRQFCASYRRAAPWQAATAIVAAVSGVVASMTGGAWMWLAGGLIIGSAVPFTLIVVMPTNKQLMNAETVNDAERRLLLARWGRLHWVRSAAAALGLLVLVGAAACRL